MNEDVCVVLLIRCKREDLPLIQVPSPRAPGHEFHAFEESPAGYEFLYNNLIINKRRNVTTLVERR